jgi:hypothetical protein
MSTSTRRRRVVPRVGSKGACMTRSTSMFLIVCLVAVGLALAAGVAGARGGVAPSDASSGGVKDMSAPVTACPDKPPAKCKPKGPGKGSGTGPTNIGGAIAEALAKMATDQVGGFVLSQLGLSELLDPNTKRFDELQAQLNGIRDQISTLQNSVGQVSSELTEIKANQFIVPLDGYVNAVQEYYRGDFKPMLNELEDYAAAEHAAVAAGLTCDDSEACKRSRQNFEDDRKTFLDHAATHLGDNGQIHRLLVPGSTGGSALKAFGEFVMSGRGSTGFLTGADSNRVFTLYRYYAEYEALATWMKAEYQAVHFKDQPKNFADFVDQEVTGFQTKELDELPARIPPGTVISLPVNTVDRTTTLNRPMWIWDWTIEAGLTWDPSKPPTQPRSVPAALTTLNTTDAGGKFHDWRVPSRSDFSGLFAGQSTRFPNDNASEFLDRILPRDSLERLLKFGNLGAHYLWTSDAAGTTGDVTCALSSSDHVAVGGYAHTGIWLGNKLTSDPSNFPLEYVPALVVPLTLKPVTITPPGGMTREQRIQWCRDEAARQVTAAIGSGAEYLYNKVAHLVATRSTGTQKFMP